MFYFCHLKKLVRPETFGPYYVRSTLTSQYSGEGHTVTVEEGGIKRSIRTYHALWEFVLEQLQLILGSRVLLQKLTSLNKKKLIHLSGTPRLITVSTKTSTYPFSNPLHTNLRPPLSTSGTPILTCTSSIHLPSSFPTTICMQSNALCPLYGVNQHSACHETSCKMQTPVHQSPVATPFATENKIIWYMIYIRDSARQPVQTRTTTQRTPPHLAVQIKAHHLRNEKVNSIRTTYVTG